MGNIAVMNVSKVANDQGKAKKRYFRARIIHVFLENKYLTNTYMFLS